MRAWRLLLFLALSLSLAPRDSFPQGGGHCAANSRIIPVTGAPGAFRVETHHGTGLVRYPLKPAAGEPDVTILAYGTLFDADGDTFVTRVDTLVVPVGTRVRWQLVSSIHTVTNGRDSGDPAAATLFSYLLDTTNPTFDSTFVSPTVQDYFCFFHEPSMVGRLVVLAGSGVPDERQPVASWFAAPPEPNPTSGPVRFRLAIPAGTESEVTVHDVQGRLLARLFQGRATGSPLTLTWDGQALSGGRSPAGVYWVRAVGGGRMETRRFQIAR